MKLHLDDAMNFFTVLMITPLSVKRDIYAARGVRMGSMVPASDWEVFASLLVGKKGNGGVSGVDLDGYEVKSAANNGGYEYQYHKDTGLEKLRHDAEVDHLFFAHSDFLSHVTLRLVHGKDASAFFNKWLKNYPNPYPQRYRNQIPFSWVKQNGTVLLEIKNGKVEIGA